MLKELVDFFDFTLNYDKFSDKEKRQYEEKMAIQFEDFMFSDIVIEENYYELIVYYFNFSSFLIDVFPNMIVSNEDSSLSLNKLFRFYQKTKFCLPNKILEFLSNYEIPTSQVSDKDYWDILDIKKCFADIRGNGFVFDEVKALVMISSLMDIMVLRRLMIYKDDSLSKKTFHHRTTVQNVEIDFRQKMRRINYNKNKLTGSDLLFKSLFEGCDIEDVNFLQNQVISTLFQSKVSVIHKRVCMDFISSVKLVKNDKVIACSKYKIKLALMPLFLRLFENEEDSLCILSEHAFKSRMDINSYDGIYKKYYIDRLKTIIGYK